MVVPLLKVILLMPVLLHFRESLKVSFFSKCLVDLSSEFLITEPLYAKLLLPNSVFVRLASSNKLLRLDSTKLKNSINIKPVLSAVRYSSLA